MKRWRDSVRAHRSELLYGRMLALVCGLWALVASAGWYAAGQKVRVFIPPQLPYGGTFSAGEHRPWQVFNFAGYIWQQYGIWDVSGDIDAAENLERLSAFFTQRFRSRLAAESEQRLRRGETVGRLRTVQPLGFYRAELVHPAADGGWIVDLDMQVEESLNGVTVRKGAFRYRLRVVAADLNPESNPWGLLIAERLHVRRLEKSA